MKLFLIHAFYNGTEICYHDFIHKVKIGLLKEELLNNPPLLTPPPPPPKKRRNKVFVLTTKGQVVRNSRRGVAPVQWSLSVLCQKSKPRQALISVTSFNVSNSIPAIESS